MAWRELTTTDISISGNINVNNSTGDVGYVIQRTDDNSTQQWYPKYVFMVAARRDDYDINTGSEFITDGEVLYEQGDIFRFNGSTFTCRRSGYYNFKIDARLDTFDGQSKLRIFNGVEKYGLVPLSYIPDNNNIQSYSASILLYAESGQEWSFIFESFGVGGVINTIFRDPDYGNRTCLITISD